MELPLRRLLALCTVSLSFSAHSHLVHEQSGTVNLTDQGAFVVVSLPVSAFSKVDDDNDGRLSVADLNRHRLAIAEQVKAGFFLSDSHQRFRLVGILLSLPQGHGTDPKSSTQVMALGRIDTVGAHEPLEVHATLFGAGAKEQTLRLRVSRNKRNHREVTLTPDRKSQSLNL
jgi:hypothetical protein